MFHLIVNRLPSFEILSAILTALLFGLSHAVNVNDSKYDETYVLLQIVMAFVIGLHYTMTLLTTSNAWECVWLHVVNNFFAMFVRSDQTPDLSDSLILGTVVCTIVMYFSMSLLLIQQRRKGYKERGRERGRERGWERGWERGERLSVESREWRDGRRASVGLLRMDDEVEEVEGDGGDGDGDGGGDVGGGGERTEKKKKKSVNENEIDESDGGDGSSLSFGPIFVGIGIGILLFATTW